MDWDSVQYEPPSIIPNIVNKWDGEDEEDNVKDNWEDDEDDKKKDEHIPKKPSLQSKKPKSRLEEKIEERERRESEKRSKFKHINLEDEADISDMTPEQIHAEKLRRQKLQEEADFEVAKDMLGLDEDESLDKLSPRSKEDFIVLKDALCKKILIHKKSEHFPYFVEELVRDLSVNLPSTDLRKLKLNIDNMFSEKVRAEKMDKKKTKGKGKAKLRIEGNDMMYDEYSAYTVDEYDDFI